MERIPLSSSILPPSVSISPALPFTICVRLPLPSTCLGPIFINIVLMIPDGLTCTLWGRSASVFFQGCAWVVVCTVCVCVCPCRAVHNMCVCEMLRTHQRDRVHVCVSVCALVSLTAVDCSVLMMCVSFASYSAQSQQGAAHAAAQDLSSGAVLRRL